MKYEVSEQTAVAILEIAVKENSIVPLEERFTKYLEMVEQACNQESSSDS